MTSSGQELLEAASQVATGALPMERLHAIEAREAAFGAASLALCLIMLFIALVTPRIAKVRL